MGRFRRKSKSPRTARRCGATRVVYSPRCESAVTLAPATRLGPYEILSVIGAGGMGEVYRARDTRLARTVAVKVLAPSVVDRPDSRQRLEREARAAAALQHPHICALHDVGHQDGIDYLVMEHLEGETLAARMKRGRLSRAECLRFAREIAAALHEAHRHAVVHRDLKPGNVMLTRTGIKLLDFGLARVSTPPPLSAGGSGEDVLTRSGPLTAAGQICGTLQYMAPEQLEGREADARTDIFAFGMVLYEMASGRRAFEAATERGLIAAIQSSEPPLLDWAELDRIVRACLAKEPDERWESAGDLLRALEWIEAKPSPSPERAAGSWIGWVMAGALAVISLALAAALARRPAPRETPVRFEFPASIGGSFLAMVPAVSPDGSRVLFSSRDAQGLEVLWVRRLDSTVATPLEGTEGAAAHFWSPDGESIGFLADQHLKKISARGGPAMTICDVSALLGASWSPAGQIVLAPLNRGPLSLVAATGGPLRQLTSLDEARGENSHRWPHFLPDGRRFVYLARSAQPENNALYLGSLDSRETKRILVVQSNAAYAPGQAGGPGHLLFVREGSLLAQRFDPDAAQVAGEPTVVIEKVHWVPPSSFSAFSVSADGRVLAYRGAGANRSELGWFDRIGRRLGTVGPAGEYSEVVLSPDGRRVAVSQPDARTGNRDVWVLDLSTGVLSRLTSNPANDWQPVWSPDGSRIAFASDRSDAGQSIYQRQVSGTGDDVLMPQTASIRGVPQSWSPDGRWLLVQRFAPSAGLWLIPQDAAGKPQPLIESPPSTSASRMSPDGRRVAYGSDESGRYEVYVRTLPWAVTQGKWRISTGGGMEPRWRRDGRELYYVTPQRELMAVAVKALEPFEASAPQRLFASCGFSFVFAPGALPFYDVSADGRRFLINCLTAETASSPVAVVVNWAGR
jgi:Tol biopolymer transport system component